MNTIFVRGELIDLRDDQRLTVGDGIYFTCETDFRDLALSGAVLVGSTGVLFPSPMMAILSYMEGACLSAPPKMVPFMDTSMIATEEFCVLRSRQHPRSQTSQEPIPATVFMLDAVEPVAAFRGVLREVDGRMRSGAIVTCGTRDIDRGIRDMIESRNTNKKE